MKEQGTRNKEQATVSFCHSERSSDLPVRQADSHRNGVEESLCSIRRWVGMTAFGLAVFFSLFFSFTNTAQAASACFCSDDLNRLTPEVFAQESDFTSLCHILVTTESECTNEKVFKSNSKRYTAQCKLYKTADECGGAMDNWKNEKQNQLSVRAVTKQESSGGFVSKLIPPCALSDTLEGECRNINVFVTLAIKVSQYLFSIIGGLSLLMFIYGGFVLILSEGNEEKITHAKEVLLAVVIGLVVAFGGYILIKFVGQAVGLDPSLRLK